MTSPPLSSWMPRPSRLKIGTCLSLCLITWNLCGMFVGALGEYHHPRSGVVQHEELFAVSTVYDGRFYLFGRHNEMGWEKAQMICSWYSGYLAEINSAAEYNFVRKVPFQRSSGQVDKFWLGGSDKGHKGYWVFPRTERPVHFMPWAKGESSKSGNEHCQTFTTADTEPLVMKAFPCSAVDGYLNSFICEIPVKKLN